MPHIENHVLMQFEPWPIQFDVVKIVVQVRTGNGYCPFDLIQQQNPTDCGVPKGICFVRNKA